MIAFFLFFFVFVAFFFFAALLFLFFSFYFAVSVFCLPITIPSTILLFVPMASAGAPLASVVRENFSAKFGSVIRQNYGTSETGNIAFVTNSDVRAWQDADAIPDGCVGAALADGVRLCSPVNGALIAQEYEGEICVRSPWMSSGYVIDGEFVKHALPYRTGDMGAWHPSALDPDHILVRVGPRLRRPIPVVFFLGGRRCVIFVFHVIALLCFSCDHVFFIVFFFQGVPF